MSEETDVVRWGQIKNIVHTLYNVKKLPLEGPDGVMEVMIKQHDFRATKAQYERYFKQWRFRGKNKKGKVYKILNQKIETRKRKGKKSSVYEDGLLVPQNRLRKKISCQGFVTIEEQIAMEQAPPQTPPGFAIRTPTAQPLVRLSFWNLPILRFQEHINYLAVGVATSSQTPTLGPGLGLALCNRPDDVHSVVESLLPNSALVDEPAATNVVIGPTGAGDVQIFNLFAFILSNNLPGETNGDRIYRWLKNRSSDAVEVLHALVSIEDPTAKAAVESVFRLAVESGDVPVVKYLLESGVNPNDHKCKKDGIPDTMSPLQFALVTKQVELARELIRAGSTIDHPDCGWKSSALVLAIIGWNMWSFPTRSSLIRPFTSSLNDEAQTHDDETHDDEILYDETLNDGPLFGLACALINAGAQVDLTHKAVSGGSKFDRLDSISASLIEDGHSPLTAAAKYRHKEIVDLLITKGVDVKFVTAQGTSALQECLYSWRDMSKDLPFAESYDNLPYLRYKTFRGQQARLSGSSVMSIITSLLTAGADPSGSTLYRFRFGPLTQYQSWSLSNIELAAYTGRIDVIKALLLCGARATEAAVQISIECNDITMLDCFLEANISILVELPRISTIARASPERRFWGEILKIDKRRQDVYTRRAAMTEAIQNGWDSIVDQVLKFETHESPPLLEASSTLTSAIESCCKGCYLRVFKRIINRNFKYRSVVLPPLVRSLHYAISHPSWELLRNMAIEAGVDLSITSEDYFHEELLRAIRDDRPILVQKLLETQALPTVGWRHCIHVPEHPNLASTALVSAIVYAGDAITDLILKAGADINGVGSCEPSNQDFCSCRTPLTAAILKGRSELVERLLDAGAFANNPPGLQGCMTPLAAATYKSDVGLMTNLLERGANPVDKVAFEFAWQSAELFRILQSALNGREQFRNRAAGVANQAVIRVIRAENLEMLKIILDSRLVDTSSLDFSPELILLSMPSICYIKPTGNLSSILYYSMFYGIDVEDLRVLELLLKSGAEPNGIIFQGRTHIETALLRAISKGSERAVRVLLEAGADPNSPLVWGMLSSPLHMAIGLGHGSIIHLLLEYGANPDAASPWKGESGTLRPLQMAVRVKDAGMVRTLLMYKADPDAVTELWRSTALQAASGGGAIEMVRLLLEYGANVNAPPAEVAGATALQYAAIGGYLGIAHLLLEHGAEVNALPARVDGRTALEGAAEHGRIDMVQLLLNSGADVHSEQFEQAVKRASENGHHATRELLVAYRV